MHKNQKSYLKKIPLIILAGGLTFGISICAYVVFIPPKPESIVQTAKVGESQDSVNIGNGPNIVNDLLQQDTQNDETTLQSHSDSILTLYEIIRRKDLKRLAQILKSNINLDEPLPVVNNETPLMIASRIGFTKGVDLLIQNKVDLDLQDNKGNTALHHAIKNKHFEIAQILIKNKALLDIKNSVSDTPLILAVKSNQLFVVKDLIKSNANVHIEKDMNEGNAVYIAYSNNSSSIMNALLQAGGIHPEDKSSIFKFINSNDVQGVKNCLSSKVSANLQYAGENPLLFFAIQKGNLNIIKLLIHYKANINIQDSKGYTPLTTALYYQQFHVVRFLLSKPIVLTNSHRSKRNPLMMAIIQKSPIDIINRLLSLTKDINHQDNQQWTALMFASHNGNETVVKKILNRKGVRLNLKNINGKTAYNLAAGKQYLNIANLLKVQ